jgi:hypothetical protein
VSRWSVSGLFGERLRVELRPGSVLLARQALLPRGRGLSDRAIPVEPEGSSEYPAAAWRASLDAFGAGLRDRRAAPGSVDAVLSDHFVRYVLIPWSESVVSDSDRLALARLCFRDVYGDLSDTWDISVDQEPAGQASFACAVDRGLISGLRDIVSRAGGRLESVTPALADCVNRHRHALKETQFCLATAEPGRISLAFRSPSGWQAVRSRRCEGPLPEALPNLLKQEVVAGSAPDSGVLYLCLVNALDAPPFAVQGWRVVRLAERGKDARVRNNAAPRAERMEPRPDSIRA